jgi:hypothetical protein
MVKVVVPDVPDVPTPHISSYEKFIISDDEEEHSVFTMEDCSSPYDSSVVEDSVYDDDEEGGDENGKEEKEDKKEVDAFSQFRKVTVNCSDLNTNNPFTRKRVIYFDFTGSPETEVVTRFNDNIDNKTM